MPTDSREESFAARASFLVLRAFFAQFWLLQAYFKLYDPKTSSLSVGHLQAWVSGTAEQFAKATPLPPWLVVPYCWMVPLAEVGIGMLLLVGFRVREALLAAALLLVSLDVGLMFQGDHDVVKSNMLILLPLLLALFGTRFDRWSVDAWRRTNRASGHTEPRTDHA